MKTLYYLMIAALILAIGVFIWVFNFDVPTLTEQGMADLQLEMIKSLWQFLLIIVLGGAVGYFFNRQERKREERFVRREARLRTHSELVKSYNKVKLIRRMLRGLVRDLGMENNEEIVIRKEYNNLMRDLIEGQLEFEYYEEFVESDRLLFPTANNLKERGNFPKELKSKLDMPEDQISSQSIPEAVKFQLDINEKYLNCLVEEFEGAYLKFAGCDRAPLKKFEALKEFIQEKKKGSDFDIKFKKPFRNVIRMIQYLADNLE